jgi:hypothetical protein
MAYASDAESGFGNTGIGTSIGANNEPGTIAGVAQGFADLSPSNAISNAMGFSAPSTAIGNAVSMGLGNIGPAALGITGPAGLAIGLALGVMSNIAQDVLGMNAPSDVYGPDEAAGPAMGMDFGDYGNAEGAGTMGEGEGAEGSDMGGATGADSVGSEGGEGSGGDGGGDGGGGGGSVICTALHARGLIPDHIIEGDLDHGRELLKHDPAVMIGYWAWGRPLARLIDASQVAAVMAWPLAAPWAYHVAGHKNPLGWLYMLVGVPICRAIGNFKMRKGLCHD